MHLTQPLNITQHNSNFPILDFISFKSKQLNNQILYTIRQPWLYYDSLKNNRPVYPNQLTLIEDLNKYILQYNSELTTRNNVKQKAFDLEQQVKIINFEEVKEVFKPKKLLPLVNSEHYWIDNIDLLSFYTKSLPNYQLLNSKSGQQIVHKVIDNFSSFRGLLKLYQGNKIKGISGYAPRPPKYKEKIQDRNLTEFNNQQFKIEKNYLVISWQGELLKKSLKNNHNVYTEEIELEAKQINRLSYKNKTGETKFHLKDNKNIKQEIINREFINDLGNKDYKIILKTTYFNLHKKLRIKLPKDFDKTRDIKQLRIVPSTTANPLSYKLEIVYEVKEYQLKNLLKEHNNKPLLNALNQVLTQGNEKAQDKAYAKFIAGGYKLDHEHSDKITNKQLLKKDSLNNLRVCSLDPGMIRLFTLTNNVGLKPIIFKDNKMVAFNQWYNKVLNQHQSELKLEWDKNTSKKHKKLNQVREHKFNDWMHLISNRIVKYLEENNFDLLVIGKNKGQKQDINIGTKNNQKFVQIPFNKLWDKIAYKAYQKGILVTEQEESYTSKSCFINNDNLPVYKKGIKQDNQQFSGKRNKGVYKTKIKINNSENSFKLHSDVNGSYNILRKFFLSIGIECNIKSMTKNKSLSRKLLHNLFMPNVWTIETMKIKSKIKAQEELENNCKIIGQNKSNGVAHGCA